MMMAQGGVSLPAGYTKIEYLESDGNSYIDTGFKPNQDTRVVMDAQYNSTTLSQFLFGCRTSSSTNMFGIYTSTTNNSFIGVYNATQLAFSVSDLQSKRKFDQNKNVCKIGDIELSATYASFASSLNMYLFACNAAGETLYCSHLRLYSCKIYDNGVLVRDFIPCTNPDGIEGLWDSVNDVFYKLLPADYTRLDFVETDGTTYIDTGYKPNNNTRVIFEGYNNNANSKWLFGTWNASGSRQFGISMQTGAGVRYGKQTAAITSQNVGEVYAELNKTAYNFNGTTGTLNTETFTCSYNLFIGALNNVGTPTDSSYGFIGRIYSVKIYNNGTLVRDFIPAMNASGEAGLYDLKNDVWYELKPVAKPKVENKITFKWFYDEREHPITGLVTLYTVITIYSTYAITSDLDITFTNSVGTRSQTLTMSKGSSVYNPVGLKGFGIPILESIVPTEDDTYIYTF
jgi:hypothetical protein